MRSTLRLAAFLLLASPALAQPGPGLPATTFQQSELFTIVSSFGSGSYGQHFLHNGYVASLRGAQGVEFYDFSNPYAPQRVSSLSGASNGVDLSEPHTYAQTDAWGGRHVVLMRGPGGLGGTGFSISDWTDIFNPQLEVSYDVPTVTGGYTTGVFWLFVQAPYVYVPAGALGLVIVDASDPKSPRVAAHIPKSQLGGFNTVLAFAIGNTLVLTNSDGGPGFARFDISVPWAPVLLNSNPTTPIPYGMNINGNKIIVPAVSGPVSSPTGGGGSFHIHDLWAPGFPEIGNLAMPSRGGSVMVQDRTVHVASSTVYRKLNIADPANPILLGSTLQPIAGGDWDWVSTMGNFAILGDDQGQGSHVIPHRRNPDTVKPWVTMVDPPDGATDVEPLGRVGITVSDMVDMESIDNTTFIVRPVGGQALPGHYSNQMGIVNFWPETQLAPNTAYEVVIPQDGMTDWAGNGIVEPFVSSFTTASGSSRAAVTIIANAPELVGTEITFDIARIVGTGPFQYSWDFGDGTPPTAFSSSSQAKHTYQRPGHFSVLCTATNGTATDTDSYVQTIRLPITTDRPTHSSTIAFSDSRNRIFNVNPDNDTVTSLQSVNFTVLMEIPVGMGPRSVAFGPEDMAWVVCQDDATVHVIHPLNNATLAIIQLPRGSAPYGIAFRPDGQAGYVTLQATGQVARIDPFQRTFVGTTDVGPDPRGIAVAADSERIFVTRHRSSLEPVHLRDDLLPNPAGEIYELSASTFTKVRTHWLRFDPGPDTEASGRGLPNYLGSPTISEDGGRLWIPSMKANIARGMFREGTQLNFESTVRTITSQIDLGTNLEDFAARIDHNDRDFASAVAFSTTGDYVFVALQGSNAIEVRDPYTGDSVAEIPTTAPAPQGIAMHTNGDLMFVHNFMARSVEVYDISGVTSSTTFQITLVTRTFTVGNERLSPQALLGKQIFYNAADPRMNEDGYISCASCHLDGGHDGLVWDITQRGEGLRNTVTLRGRAGMGHGNVHWTANFDEVQDFENDIRAAFGGDGFMSNALFNEGTRSLPLGLPKAGLSPELDALAAYVSSLTSFGRSPHRDQSGQLTAAGQRGKAVFLRLGCAQCHSGTTFRDGQLHDVGTIRQRSGQASGGPLVGIDTPTLRGLWDSAPYLHDGSAATLFAVLTRRNRGQQHGTTATLNEQELFDLVQYLLQIDDLEPAAQ